MRRFVALAAMALATGCAAIVEGQTQVMTFDVLPREALCLASRAGQPLGTITAAANTLTVQRQGDPIQLSCAAAGYRPEAVAVEPVIAPLGVLGAPVDYPMGTFWKYPERVVVTMYRQ
jgi:hypothetical protein